MNPQPQSGGGRPRDVRIDHRVLAAARLLLAERGLRAMSLDAVAELAGVSRSAIYRRWASSDELALDAIDDALGQLPGPDPSIPPDAFWTEFRDGLRVAAAGLAHPIEHDAIQLWLGRLTHQPKLHRRYWERRIQPRRQRAINSLRLAAAQGQVTDATDADLLVDMLAGLLLYRYFLTPHELRTHETDEQWLDRIVDLAERLLAPSVPDNHASTSPPTSQ
ncbi:MAG: TetR/AcrR family transcriptional regulator [Actinomycetota bacterium]|nr:TetR/AcrR family transcriptional regulator [Actinomycetota bacterium]